jgi:N4-gp56 family major capsid protein
MATGPSTTTTLSDLIGEIVSDEVLSAAYASRVMRPLVFTKEVPQGAGSITIPRFAPLTPAGLSQGVAPDQTEWDSEGEKLTPAERGVLVSISKMALWADPWSDLEPYGSQLGRSLAQDEDKLILATTASLSDDVNAQTSTGADVDLDNLLDAVGKLEAENAPAPYYGVFHPVSWGRIRKEIANASIYAAVGVRTVEGFGTGMTNMAGYVGSPFGVDCFMSSSVPERAATSSDCSAYTNLVASKQAIGYAYTYDLRVDVDDNIPRRAYDCMAWYAGAVAILVDEYGIRLEDKGQTAPTG